VTTMFAWFAGILGALTVQCQVCSHASFNDAHDHVVTWGENMCNATPDQAQTELTLGKPLDESVAALGPVRSHVKQFVPDVTFQDFTWLVSTKLVTEQMPAALSPYVTRRERVQSAMQPDPPVEDWLFETEINPDAVPEAVLQHLRRAVDNPMAPKRPLIIRESWHVELQEQIANVEVSTGPSDGSVRLTVRMDIQGLQGEPRKGCDVDCRLYAQQREHGKVLPFGFVEQMSAAHRIQVNSLRDLILALSGGSDAEPPTAASASSAAPAQAMPREKTDDAQAVGPQGLQAAGPHRCGAIGRADEALSSLAKQDGPIVLDNSLLMKMASGI